ncbi:MAG: SAM-dependent methyltransferase [Marinilabiliaceae bacterium]|nr:SAM-dependent methyltransferase [Marinilabiliaceae bacterium]
MNNINISPIGIVQNSFNKPTSHHEIKSHQSIVVIDDKYSEALLNIECCNYIDIVFFFHQSEAGSLSGKIYNGETRGVFASRSPKRPNLIGITTVKLIKKEGNKLFVLGLDAINQSPVIDIKCCDTSFLEMANEKNEIHCSILKAEPRIEIINLIANNNTEQLLLKAGQLHGHFCPGLAMGVKAATFAMNKLKAKSDGMEDLLAITETNNCFADGVQFVTGCSFGNNSLIFKDLGKTAFTLTFRNGKGIRICSKHESQQIIKEQFPDFNKYYQQVVVEQNHCPEIVNTFKKVSLQRAFETLNIDFDSLFTVQYVESEIPSYAKILESVICSKCGESVMKSRTNTINNNFICYSCSGSNTYILNGNGIYESKR